MGDKVDYGIELSTLSPPVRGNWLQRKGDTPPSPRWISEKCSQTIPFMLLAETFYHVHQLMQLCRCHTICAVCTDTGEKHYSSKFKCTIPLYLSVYAYAYLSVCASVRLSRYLYLITIVCLSVHIYSYLGICTCLCLYSSL